MFFTTQKNFVFFKNLDWGVKLQKIKFAVY